MTAPFSLSTAARNAQNDAVIALIPAGFLDIYDAGAVLLAHLPLANPAAPASSGGVSTFTNPALTNAEAAGGTATNAKLTNAASTVVASGLTVGATGTTTADGACNSASPTVITSATAGFATADEGKLITLAGAGIAGADYKGRIASRTSSTSVFVYPPISTTVSGAALHFGPDVELITATILPAQPVLIQSATLTAGNP